MLLAGSDDGVYAIEGVFTDGPTNPEQRLEATDIYRLRQFPGVDGVFVTAESGLYYSPDGYDFSEIPVPGESVYAVVATPEGDRLYAGTRPARLYSASVGEAVPEDPGDWTEVAGFRELRERADWGIPRHDGVAQIRSLATHTATPERLVVGVEVGGVHVSDDGGQSWSARHVRGFDAPHTDDIHHIALGGPDEFVASTGSGLFRSTDAGRTWTRLDDGHDQRYFRSAFLHGGSVHAGAAPGSSSSWESHPDHALFESPSGGRLEALDSPTPEEVALGWCEADGTVLTVTHRGSLLARREDGFESVGSIPTPGAVRGRYLPLTWLDH